MYSSKRDIHALVSLIRAHGVTHVVACPGSRNAVIINDMNECRFKLHPVTDERSAGFVALGLALSTCSPVAVCVTSGSALLNLLPAVAEAYYRNIPILVISADRPARYIDTWDGQTIHQQDALLPYAQTISVNESVDEKNFKWNELKINKALSCLSNRQQGPVHLNIEIEEPLFDFSTANIIPSTKVNTYYSHSIEPIPIEVMAQIASAKCPVVFIGQYEQSACSALETIEKNDALLVLPEILTTSPNWHRTSILEQVVENSGFHPDLIIHIGGNLVNKQLKNFFRKHDGIQVIRIEEKSLFPNTLSYLKSVIYANVEDTLRQLATLVHPNKEVKLWKEKLSFSTLDLNDILTRDLFSDLYVMQQVAKRIQLEWDIHLANSTTVRNATMINDFRNHKIFANRGTNGIEGSISTAVGYALGATNKVIAMSGDLSFFYDANALFNTEIPNNLSLIVFNNGGGQIFRRLPGITDSQALDKFISASHTYSAKGIAESYGIKYFSLSQTDDLPNILDEFLACNGQCPALLEVFTTINNNEQARKVMENVIKTNYSNKL